MTGSWNRFQDSFSRSAAIALICASLALGACAQHSRSVLPILGQDYAQRERLLAGLDDWQLKGRIGLRTVDDGFSGSLLWRQRGETLAASLHGPLGVGALQLDGNAQHLRLAQGDGDVVELDDPERALKDRYGWTVPVGSFRYWVLGIANPSTKSSLDISEDGKLRALTQDSWRVVYSAYQQVGDEELPKKLTARSGDITMTVSIKAWQIPY